MDLLTSYQGIPHLTSAQFRSIIESITGAGSYIADIDEKMAIELAENNTVKIRSGVLIHHGGVMQIKKGTYDPATYQNGTQAMKRIDLLVARYTKSADTKIEKTEWVIIQGTPDEESPVAPAYTEGNMQDGDLVDDCPFAELHFDGINVVEVVMLVDVTENISTLKEIIKRMIEEIDKLNSKLFPGIDVSNTISSGSVNSSSSTDVYTATNDCWLRVRGSDTISIGIKTASDFAVLFSGSDSNIKTYIMPLKKGQTARGIGNFEWRAYGVL